MTLQLRELMAAEATWKADREHSAGLLGKLEEARGDLRREREENAELRRKAAATRDLEADLREERDRRQSLERKLADAQRDSSRVAEAVGEANQLRLEREAVRGNGESACVHVNKRGGGRGAGLLGIVHHSVHIVVCSRADVACLRAVMTFSPFVVVVRLLGLFFCVHHLCLPPPGPTGACWPL